MITLIEDPLKWLSVSPEEEFGNHFAFFDFYFTESRVGEKFKADAMKAAGTLGLKFLPSQQKLYEQLLSNRLQLVWGPPGTGYVVIPLTKVLFTHELEKRIFWR